MAGRALRTTSRLLPAALGLSGPPSAAPRSGVELAKTAAGYAAVAHCFKPDRHRIIGIGSGSTVVAVVEALSDLKGSLGEHRFVPTGFQSSHLIKSAGLKLAQIDEVESIDLAFDGADDVDEQLAVIKGGGACHLREKVVMDMSRHNVIVADWRKNSKTLGRGLWRQGIPVEVVPFAVDHVIRQVEQLGVGSSALPGPRAVLRLGGSAKAGPVVSDNSGLILDVLNLEQIYSDPAELRAALKSMTGVVEVGLWGDVNEAFFGNEDGTVLHKRREVADCRSLAQEEGRRARCFIRQQNGRKLERAIDNEIAGPSYLSVRFLLRVCRSYTDFTVSRGQVALPGGKTDPEDISPEATARREAFEEVGLPLDTNAVRYLTTLPPFLSRSLLLVTPVVVFILDSSLKPEVNPTEVDAVFSFPLAGFSTNTVTDNDPSLYKSVQPAVARGEAPYHWYKDFSWFGDCQHRYHEFAAKPQSITGLTAEILLNVAEIAYGPPQGFNIRAPDEWSQQRLIEAAMKDPRWTGETKL